MSIKAQYIIMLLLSNWFVTVTGYLDITFMSGTNGKSADKLNILMAELARKGARLTLTRLRPCFWSFRTFSTHRTVLNNCDGTVPLKIAGARTMFVWLGVGGGGKEVTSAPYGTRLAFPYIGRAPCDLKAIKNQSMSSAAVRICVGRGAILNFI